MYEATSYITEAPRGIVTMTMDKGAFLAWRNRMGLSRREAAEALGRSPDLVASVELGRRAVSPGLAARCAEVERAPVGRGRVPSTQGAPVRVVGGGTVSHVRTHLALAAPAYGSTAKAIARESARLGHPAELTLTRMADPSSPYETDVDLAALADDIVADRGVKVVYWNPAVCDFHGAVGDVPSHRKAERLRSRGGPTSLALAPAPKVVERLRATRKDLFLVAFKTTTFASPDEMYERGLALLKGASANLVLANDVGTGLNMLVTPEESRRHVTRDRQEAIESLVATTSLRAANTFVRSEVVPGPGVPWDSPEVPEALRRVVDHCVARGAYKPFAGRTVGHFAARGRDGTLVTSRRKSDLNRLAEVGMVRIETRDHARVVAFGGKPSVGGQSQRCVFEQHPDADCIVHFHAPMRADAPDAIPVADQLPYQCGSIECGLNTSRNLRPFGALKAVMLDEHGPNVAFAADADPEAVIAFIERNFDLSAKTGGTFSEAAARGDLG